MSLTDPPPDRVSILRAAIVVEGGIAAVAGALGWVFALPLTDSFTLGLRAIGQGLAGCLPLAALMLVVSYNPLEPFKRFNRQIESTISIWVGFGKRPTTCCRPCSRTASTTSWPWFS